MKRHESSFEVEATPDEVWAVFWGPRPRVIEHGDVRIEILHPGNPMTRALHERRVHRFISRENDRLMRAGVEQGLRARRARP